MFQRREIKHIKKEKRKKERNRRPQKQPAAESVSCLQHVNSLRKSFLWPVCKDMDYAVNRYTRWIVSQIGLLYCKRFLRWTERCSSSSALQSQCHFHLIQTELWQQASWSRWATTEPSWCGSRPLARWENNWKRGRRHWRRIYVGFYTGNRSDAAATPGLLPSSSRKQAAVWSARKETHLFGGTSFLQSFLQWLFSASPFIHSLDRCALALSNLLFLNNNHSNKLHLFCTFLNMVTKCIHKH